MFFSDTKSPGEEELKTKLEGENPFNKAELLSASSTNYSQGHPGAQHRLPATGTKMQRSPDHTRQLQKQQAFTASYSGTLMKLERKTSSKYFRR